MIESLIGGAVLMAPEIGDALVKYVARSVIEAAADEAKGLLAGGFSGLGGALASLGAEALGGAVGKVEEVSPEMQARVAAILTKGLKDFNLVLVDADHLADLRRAAEVAKETRA